MDKPLIQIVEDDPPIQNLIRVTLKANGYRELVAETGQAAILEAATHNPAVILLDLGLPDLDGVEVIRQIRTWTNTPIIVISARTNDPDKIAALDAGAAARSSPWRIWAAACPTMRRNTFSRCFTSVSIPFRTAAAGWASVWHCAEPSRKPTAGPSPFRTTCRTARSLP